MHIRKLLLTVPIFAMFLAGCEQEKPPAVEGLHFPVAVLYSNTALSVFKDAGDLKMMNTQLVINSDTPPVLIDSAFTIYSLDKLRSIHGGLWLMANPVGLTGVTFDLTKAPTSGLDAARATMRTQLDKETWRDDLDRRRAHLAKATTLGKMVSLVQPEE